MTITRVHTKAAAIMVGNASAESELIPQTVHDQGTGYGIYGARDPRKARSHNELRRTKMFEWLAANGYDRDSLVGQTRSAIEARKRGGPAWRALQGATEHNLGTSGVSFEHFFEGPARDNDRNKQIAAAYRAYAERQSRVPPAEPIHHVIVRARQAILRGRVPPNPYGSIYGPAQAATPQSSRDANSGVPLPGTGYRAPGFYPNFKAPPLGQNSSWRASGSSSQVAMNQKTEIHVHGVDDPQEAARRVGRHQTRVNSDLLKNTMGAVG